MDRPRNESLYSVIDAKLAEVLRAVSTPPAWLQAWKQLHPRSTWQERLRVYQMIRVSNSLPEAAGFYLVSRHVDEWVDEQAGEALHELEARMGAMRREHGLGDDDFWASGAAPPEYERLRREYHDAWDKLLAAKLGECGEQEMAWLLRQHPERFEQLTEAGRQFFHGTPRVAASDGTQWLDSLMEGVASNITVEAESGPLKYRYSEEEGLWEIIVFTSSVELLGGVLDGEVVSPGFTLDLEGLRSLFDHVTDFGWSALGSPTEGACVSIEGVYMGHEVFLRVLAHSPDDEDPGMKLDTSKNG